MEKRSRKPTRRDLLDVIAVLQDQIGRVQGLIVNDRSQQAFAQSCHVLKHSFDLCIAAQGRDRPSKAQGPWFDPCTDWENRI